MGISLAHLANSHRYNRKFHVHITEDSPPPHPRQCISKQDQNANGTYDQAWPCYPLRGPNGIIRVHRLAQPPLCYGQGNLAETLG